MALVLSDQDADLTDYVTGLAAAAVLIAVIFLVIHCVILVFMCCRKRRVGFWSGRPMDRESSEYTSCAGLSRSTWVRAVFISSGVIFLVFTNVLVAKGLTNLQDTVHIVHQSAIDVGIITAEADSIISGGLQDVRGIATAIRTSLEGELASQNFCPADPEFNNNAAAQDIRDEADQALEMLGQLNDLEEVDDIADSIEDLSTGSADLQDTTADIDLAGAPSLLVLIPFTIVPCLLVACAILSHFEVPFPMRAVNYFLLPLFILEVLLCVVLASGTVALAAANSDFCAPTPDASYVAMSPDTTLLRMLDLQGFTVQSESVIRQVAEYYIAQCQDVTNPYTFLTDYLPDLNQAQVALDELLTTFAEDGVMMELGLYCNRDFRTLEALMVEMQTILDVLLEAIDRTLDLVGCERMVPIYHRAMYDGACTSAVTASMWFFVSSLMMAVAGTLMLLLRSAIRPNVDEDEDADYPAKPVRAVTGYDEDPRYYQ